MSGAAVNGKVIVITGGVRGIGLATATSLHNLGATVPIGGIDETSVKQAGTDLDLGFYARLDVTDRHSFTALLDNVERQLGPIDVLVNNAGLCPAGRFLDQPDEVTSRAIAINLACLAAITPMPGIATYTGTKHAVLGYTDSVRLEFAWHRCDSVDGDADADPDRRHEYEERARRS